MREKWTLSMDAWNNSRSQSTVSRAVIAPHFCRNAITMALLCGAQIVSAELPLREQASTFASGQALGLITASEEAGATKAAPISERCEVQSNDTARADELRVNCGEKGVTFRAAEGAETARNAETGSIAVILHGKDDPKVFIVRPGLDGIPVIDDITEDLAGSVGRAFGVGLRDLVIDLTQFAEVGTVGIYDANVSRTLSRFSVSDLVAVDAARRSKPASPSPVIHVEPQGKGPAPAQ